jgi:hypothetical protein
MIRAVLLSPWVGDGLTLATARRPQFQDDFPGVAWVDVTGQAAPNLPTAPNLVGIEIRCDAATFAAIEAHPAYADAVLTAEEGA